MGTTADKLSYLNTTKAQIKESINLTNINITNEPFRYYAYAIKKGIINVLNDPKAIWNNFEKVTGEGTSIELTSTENAPIEIDLKGNTYQATTQTGKNKFSTDFKTTDTLTTYTKIDNNSFSFTCSGAWKNVIFVVPCKENTDYFFNYVDTSNRTYCYIKGTQTQTDLMGRYYGYFLTFNSGANTTLTINISNGNNSNITSGTISNIQLEEGTSATTFEPFVPYSPTPSYPQEIHNVSGDNTITISNSDNTETQIQLISLGDIELCKIGDYQDYIYKEDGKWYLHKEIGKVVLDGSEDWTAFTGVNYEYQVILFDGLSSDTSNQFFPAISNLYKNNNVVAASLGNYEFSHFSTIPSGTQKKRFIRVRNNGITTLANFKSSLQSNNLIVYVPLATPTNTEITDSTLIYQLEKTLYSYSGQTNIFQTNNDLPFILDVKALKLIE